MKGFKTHLFIVVIAVNLLNTSAKAEAEAEAEPQAEPEAQAQGLYNMGGMGTSYLQPRAQARAAAPYGAAPGQCGGVEECCDMVDQGCCVNQGQQCFTTWERQCSNPYQPQCITGYVTKCENYQVKSCRTVQDIKEVPIPVNVCRVEKENTCFPYQKKVCKRGEKIHDATYDWITQDYQVGEEPKKMCKQVRKCTIIDDVEKIKKKVPEKECRKIKNPRKVCITITVESPSITISVTKWKIEYRQQCYEIPKPKCYLEPCTYDVVVEPVCPVCPDLPGPGVCPSPTCQRPLGVAAGGVQVGGGRIGGGDMCGNCRQQNVQKCTKLTQKCKTVMEKVCQSVPIKIPYQVNEERPQPPRQELKCEIKYDEIDDCRIVWKEKIIEKPVKRCKDGYGTECVDYKIPTFTLIEEKMNDTATFKIPTCDIEEVTDKYCVYLPTKSVCDDNKSAGKVRITKKVCDRVETKQECKEIPESYCSGRGGQVCQMVPKQVCQDSCQQTDYCNYCVVAIQRGDPNCSTCDRAFERSYVN